MLHEREAKLFTVLQHECGDAFGFSDACRYVSKVTLQPPRIVRSTVADSMLFHHLDSSWRMEPGPTHNTCWLTFEVDFAFNSVLYTHLADMFFSEVGDKGSKVAAEGWGACRACALRSICFLRHISTQRGLLSQCQHSTCPPAGCQAHDLSL
jgi:hypothetical protein